MVNPVPPQDLIHWIGDGDYQKIGDEFFKYFIELGGLKPEHNVLDVGCGCGRMARPLIPFLKGHYCGFDIMWPAIDWCQKNYSPHFKFDYADIFNRGYNPGGRINIREYCFPYKNESFDFIFLTSVFTHMFPIGIKHYLSEIHRVLKPTGRCLMTFFLGNLAHKKDGYSINNLELPEAMVAYEEQNVRELLSGFKIIEPIHYGSWSGRESFLSFQDIVIVEKVG
jgi:SAM-dependent methyltransferase